MQEEGKAKREAMKCIKCRRSFGFIRLRKQSPKDGHERCVSYGDYADLHEIQ